MTIQEKIQAIQGAINTIEQKFTEIALKRTAIAMQTGIEKRVREKSIKADGTKFGMYSERKVPVYYFMYSGMTRNIKFSDDEKREGISYADFRKKLGKKNTYKNFELTGDMWRGFGIQSIRDYEFNLGGTNRDAQDKLQFNSYREGINIIMLNKEEEREAINEIMGWLTEVIKMAIE